MLRDDKDHRHFAFPNNTIIKKHDFMVIIENEKKFNRVHPDISNYVGTFTFGFGTDDMVRIYDNNLELIDSVKYSNEYPWYPEADGLGPSLELISPELDNTIPQSWRPSIKMHGTPGRSNSVTSIEDFYQNNNLYISVFPHPISISANIEFENRSDGFVTVEIYDLLGNMIKSILSQYMMSGIFNTFWDSKDNFGNNVGAGIYFLSVKTSSDVYIQKLVKSEY